MGGGVGAVRTLVHPAGIGDSIRMGQIGSFPLGLWNRPKRVQSSGGMY